MSVRIEVRGGATPAEVAALASAIEATLTGEAGAEAPTRRESGGWRRAAWVAAVGDGGPWVPSGWRIDA